MLFSALAYLSGIALFASGAAAAPSYSDDDYTTHQINVSDNNADLIFDPPYIVRQPIFHYPDRCADSLSLSFSECLRGRYCRVYLPSQEPLCDPVKL